MPTTNPDNKLTHIKHLRQFYQPQKQLFIDAQQLPQFFLTNLIDDLRVVKYFHNDPQANITIFYYQYLKLCFEIDNVDYESYIQKIYQLIRTQGFQFYFQLNDPQKEMKNAQYKSLLIDFFQLMNTSSMTIDNILREYPILNDVFINFFRTVVMIASITSSYDAYIDKNELFDFLSSFFSVDISSYDKCLKFVESDIFVYEEDQQNIYMAYIAEEMQQKEDQGQEEEGFYNKRGSKLLQHEMKTVKEDQYESEVSANTEQTPQPLLPVRLVQHSATNSSLIPSNDQNIQINLNTLKPRAKTIIKQSYIESQFADYTSFSNNISNFGKNVSAQHEKEVFIQTLQPNTTVNETQSQGGNKRVNFEEIVQQKMQQKQQLIRVQSAQNNVMLSVNHAQSLQIQINQPLYSKLQQPLKNELSKSTSQPNFLYRQKSLHQLAQSCYQSLDSNLQPEFQQQENNQTLKQQQSQKSLQQESQKSGSKIMIDDGEKIMKKGLTSLGLEQQGHMFVSYEQPTKDPGFMEKDLTSRFVEQAVPQHQQQPTNKSLYQNLTDYNIYKPSTTTNTQKSIKLNQPLFHNPTIKPTYHKIQQKSSFPNSRLAESANSQRQHFYNPSSSKNLIKENVMYSPFQQKLKLNVTKQFTNSFVMKSMSQPYKTEVYRTRERAREFRKNIYQQFIYQSGNTSEMNYNKKLDEFNYTSHLKKPSSRTSIPSQSSLKTNSVKNIPLSEPFQTTTSTKTFTTNKPYQFSPSQRQQQSPPIYPVSMVKQQQKVYNNYQQLSSLTNSKLDITYKNDLSKISQIKQISQVISSQSRKSIQANNNIINVSGNNRSGQKQVLPMSQGQSQGQSKVTVSIYNPGTQTNSYKKLPAYQPVLLKGPKPTLQQQQPQATYQPQPQYQPNNYTVHTVMPQSHHYHHTSNHGQHQYQQHKPHYPSQTALQTVGMKTYPQQGLMSMIPQAQKPLPLYVPFERRK